MFTYLHAYRVPHRVPNSRHYQTIPYYVFLIQTTIKIIDQQDNITPIRARMNTLGELWIDACDLTRSVRRVHFVLCISLRSLTNQITLLLYRHPYWRNVALYQDQLSDIYAGIKITLILYSLFYTLYKLLTMSTERTTNKSISRRFLRDSLLSSNKIALNMTSAIRFSFFI